MKTKGAIRYTDTLGLKNKIARLVWSTVWLLFARTNPKIGFNWWRITLLRLFGAKIGEGCKVLPGCSIWAPWNLEMGKYSVLADGVDCYTMDKIIIGDHVSISQRVFLCTGSHDISSLTLPLITAPIIIKNHCWVCAEVFIGQGCTIETGSVIAARSSVISNTQEWSVSAGNPARFIKHRHVISE